MAGLGLHFNEKTVLFDSWGITKPYKKNSTARRRAMASMGICSEVRIIMMVTMDALGADGIAKVTMVVSTLKINNDNVVCKHVFISKLCSYVKEYFEANNLNCRISSVVDMPC